MILPDLILPSKAHQRWSSSGVDSLELCVDKTHFLNFPYPVVYEYNSRGFRDQEWPNSIQKLQQAIWCIGDSFTVGIGSPKNHTWPAVLQQQVNTRTINVSMDGASNNWIARKAKRILETVRPNLLIIHWSFISRREEDIDLVREKSWQTFYQNIKDDTWPWCAWQDRHTLPTNILQEIDLVHGGWNPDAITEENCRLPYINSTDEQDMENTLACIKSLETLSCATKIVHSFVPEFAPDPWNKILLSRVPGIKILEFAKLDRARDGYHYDIKTSGYLVDQIMPLLI